MQPADALTLIHNNQVPIQKNQIFLAQRFLNLQITFQISPKPFPQSSLAEQYPFGSFPALRTPHSVLFSTTAILRYLARKGKSMYGKNLAEHTEVDEYLDFCSLELLPVVNTIQLAMNNTVPLTKRIFYLYNVELIKMMGALNERIKTRQWLAGAYLSLADLALVPIIHTIFTSILSGLERSKLPYLTSWYLNMSHTNHFKEVFGAPNLSTYVNEYLTPEQQQYHTQIQQKKEQKLHFPRWIDKIKYQMLNHQDKKQVIQTMISERPIEEPHCIYKIEYQNYSNQCSDELTTINLNSNILSHLESLRDSTFAVTGVYGHEGNYSIKGVWLFSEANLPPIWETHPLYQYHCYTKLFPESNQEHKNILNTYWLDMEIGTVNGNGYPVVAARYFA